MEPTPELPGLPQPPYHPLVTNNSPAPLRNSGLLLQVKYPRLQFVPFYAFFLCLLPSPTRSAETHMPAIHHQNRQLRIPPLRLAFLGHLLEPLLHLFFSSPPHPLHQRMNNRVVHLTAPLGRHQPGGGIGTGHRRRKGQLLLQCRTHLLVGSQTPPLPNRTAPMSVC